MVVGIRYDEGNRKNLKYKSVYLHFMRNDKNIDFKSGDFVKDWYDCIKTILTGDYREPMSHSSSVNHFIMDGAPYDSAYLKFAEDDEPFLDYEYDHNEPGIEFFVMEGTQPTWTELRKICNDEKKSK